MTAEYVTEYFGGAREYLGLTDDSYSEFSQHLFRINNICGGNMSEDTVNLDLSAAAMFADSYVPDNKIIVIDTTKDRPNIIYDSAREVSFQRKTASTVEPGLRDMFIDTPSLHFHHSGKHNDKHNDKHNNKKSRASRKSSKRNRRKTGGNVQLYECIPRSDNAPEPRFDDISDQVLYSCPNQLHEYIGQGEDDDNDNSGNNGDDNDNSNNDNDSQGEDDDSGNNGDDNDNNSNNNNNNDNNNSGNNNNDNYVLDIEIESDELPDNIDTDIIDDINRIAPNSAVDEIINEDAGSLLNDAAPSDIDITQFIIDEH